MRKLFRVIERPITIYQVLTPIGVDLTKKEVARLIGVNMNTLTTSNVTKEDKHTFRNYVDVTPSKMFYIDNRHIVEIM